MKYFYADGGDDDEDGDAQEPDIHPNDLGDEGTSFGEGHDPIEDTVL